MARKTKQEKEDNQQIKLLGEVLHRNGVVVRRENLSRGSSFRVKSGYCSIEGETHLFVDRRLPLPQQISVLVDSIIERNCKVNKDELALFPDATKSLIALS